MSTPISHLLAARGCTPLFLLALALLAPTTANAQFYDDDLPSTQQELDAYYAELADDVSELERHSKIIKRVAKIAMPSVVHIDAEHSSDPRRNFARRSGEEAGSGVIILYEGDKYILTNRHLIKYADESTVKIKLADGREIKPTKLWTDPGTDVAVMAIDDEKVLPARVGDSRAMDVGDFVLAIGSPFGLRHSVSYGIVSAKGRRDLELATDGVNFQNFIQTDAAINPGNSGGPLINLKGEVIGINTAIASSSGRNEGIGFSIPINMAMVVARQLIETGEVNRAFLGVNLDSKFTQAVAVRLGLDRPRGAKVTAVTPGAPAEKAGLKIDDIILRFNGTWVEDDSHLVNLVSLTEVGKEVDVVVFRDKQLVTVKVAVADRDSFRP